MSDQLEKNYSKREIDSSFEHIRESLLNQDKLLTAIFEQTKKTNGRVNKLENWRSYIGGGLAVIGIIGIPMIWFLLRDVRQDNQLITAHIAQANIKK